MKNLCGKMRKIENPYEIWQGFDSLEGWEWLVLKKYQSPENETKNPYARWFCAVKSPFTYDRYEFGDTYIKDIVHGTTRMIKGEARLDKVMREVDYVR